jgi:predicted ribosomally synthesized peptide with SipW-like signal peptide
MTNSKHTKRALLASILSVVVCAAMLAGSTFAWFTDSVTSAGNIIKSGNLDVALEWANGTEALDTATWQDASTGAIFNYNLWEPGYTEARHVRISNKGNLALKYEIRIAANGEVSKLADVIDVYYIKDGKQITSRTGLTDENKIGTLSQVLANPYAAKGHILAGENAVDVATIALKMQESAGNEYQGLAIGSDFSIQLVATQYTSESDSFDDQYDKDAPLNFVPVATADELTKAVADGENVSLTAPIELSERLEVKKDITINGNGNAITIPTDRVINLANIAEPITVTLNNVDLNGPTQGTYTRGISIYDVPKVKVVMDNCSLSANYYAINLASAAPNAEIVVKNTTLTGWCAFQTHSPYSNVTFENCTLIGLNDKGFNADGWNDFATVVVNGYSEGNPDPDGAHGGTFTFKNCRIEANQTTGNTQYLLSVRAKNTTLIAENCSFYVDGTEVSIEDVPNYVSVYPEVIDSFNFTLK